MTVGMLLATILLVLTFSGVLSGAWERLGIRQRTAGAWLLAMLAALLMPDGPAWRGAGESGGAGGDGGGFRAPDDDHPPAPGAGARAAGQRDCRGDGLLVLILSDGQADALWACAMLIGAAACFLGVSRRGMLLCSLMGLLVAQGAAGVSGVLRVDVQPWTDAALLCASVSTALAEIVRRTAIFLLTPPGVKGGHRG